MKIPVKTLLLVSALTALGGCVAVPVGYYEPAPVVHVSPPAYYGPSLRFGYYGWRHGHDYGGRRGHGCNHNRNR